MSEIDGIGDFDDDLPIVYVSDIHGYLEDGRSALRALGETGRFPAVVTPDEDGRLHWAGNDYVLVINGDLIDRGPSNDACLDLAWRLQSEAPTGRVRYHIGNHEMGILLPALVRWPDAFSTSLSGERRVAFLERVLDERVAAAFEGHEHTYSHAGSNEAFDPAEVNAELRAATEDLLEGADAGDDRARQRRIESEYERIFGIGSRGGRGPDAGLCWMDFQYLDASAPPQIVGHTMHYEPTRKGNVVCGNLIRANQGTPGGEGVLVETPDALTAVVRQADGSVSTSEL